MAIFGGASGAMALFGLLVSLASPSATRLPECLESLVSGEDWRMCLRRCFFQINRNGTPPRDFEKAVGSLMTLVCYGGLFLMVPVFVLATAWCTVLHLFR